MPTVEQFADVADRGLGGGAEGWPPVMRRFRFGFQVRQETTAELRASARSAEAAGFDVISTWDHLVDGWAPLSPLLAMADSTTRLRICPLVLNNDFHHPVHLARELASTDHLTGGRLEVGLAAGRRTGWTARSPTFGHRPAGETWS